MEDEEDYRSIMNWLEKVDLRESIINDKLYYWDINSQSNSQGNFQGTEDNNYNMKEQKKEERK